MTNLADWSMRRAAGLLLVFGFVANLAGVLMFSMREGTEDRGHRVPLRWSRASGGRGSQSHPGG
jgi:hypothetical protein